MMHRKQLWTRSLPQLWCRSPPQRSSDSAGLPASPLRTMRPAQPMLAGPGCVAVAGLGGWGRRDATRDSTGQPEFRGRPVPLPAAGPRQGRIRVGSRGPGRRSGSCQGQGPHIVALPSKRRSISRTQRRSPARKSPNSEQRRLTRSLIRVQQSPAHVPESCNARAFAGTSGPSMSRGASDGLDLRTIIVWVTVGVGRDYRKEFVANWKYAFRCRLDDSDQSRAVLTRVRCFAATAT